MNISGHPRHKEDGYEASKEDKRPVRQVQVKRQDNPQPAVRTMGRPHPAQEETKTAVQEQQPRQQTAQEMIKPERRPEQQKPVAKMQLPQPDPVQKINAADSDKVNETVPASLKKDETGRYPLRRIGRFLHLLRMRQARYPLRRIGRSLHLLKMRRARYPLRRIRQSLHLLKKSRSPRFPRKRRFRMMRRWILMNSPSMHVDTLATLTAAFPEKACWLFMSALKSWKRMESL